MTRGPLILLKVARMSKPDKEEIEVITAFELLCDKCREYGYVCFPCWIEQGSNALVYRHKS
jgi:hypothetical protein